MTDALTILVTSTVSLFLGYLFGAWGREQSERLSHIQGVKEGRRQVSKEFLGPDGATVRVPEKKEPLVGREL